jgi:hypothetical protein
MSGVSRAAKLSWRVTLVLALFLTSVLASVPVASGSGKKALKLEKAYIFAGVIVDRSRKVKRNKTTSEVKVVEKMPEGKNPGKSYDVVFLVRPSAVSEGKILTLTSGLVASCRSNLKKFLSKTLSPKRIKKAYKGAKLATVDKNATAQSLADQIAKNGWLNDCAAKPKGEVDVFQVLIVNESDK